MKKILITTAVLSTSCVLFAGCFRDKAITKDCLIEESIVKLSKINTADIVSEGGYKAEIKSNDKEIDIETVIYSDLVYDVYNKKYKLETTATRGTLGESETQKAELYTLPDNSEKSRYYVTYSGTDTNYSLTYTKSRSEDYSVNILEDVYKKIQSVSDNFSLDNTTKTFNDMSCYTISGEVTLDKLNLSYDEITMFDTEIFGSRLDIENNGDESVNIELYFDSKTSDPVGIKIDMKNVVEKMIDTKYKTVTNNISVDVSDTEYTITFSGFNGEYDINVPSDVVSSAKEAEN